MKALAKLGTALVFILALVISLSFYAPQEVEALTAPSTNISSPIFEGNLSGTVLLNLSLRSGGYAAFIANCSWAVRNASSDTWVHIGYNTSGDKQIGCLRYWNTSNISLDLSGNISLNVSYNVSGGAPSRTSSTHYVMWNLTVDNTPPTATILTPVNLSNHTSNSLLINFTVNATRDNWRYNATIGIDSGCGYLEWCNASGGIGGQGIPPANCYNISGSYDLDRDQCSFNVSNTRNDTAPNKWWNATLYLNESSNNASGFWSGRIGSWYFKFDHLTPTVNGSTYVISNQTWTLNSAGLYFNKRQQVDFSTETKEALGQNFINVTFEAWDNNTLDCRVKVWHEGVNITNITRRNNYISLFTRVPAWQSDNKRWQWFSMIPASNLTDLYNGRFWIEPECNDSFINNISAWDGGYESWAKAATQDHTGGGFNKSGAINLIKGGTWTHLGTLLGNAAWGAKGWISYNTSSENWASTALNFSLTQYVPRVFPWALNTTLFRLLWNFTWYGNISYIATLYNGSFITHQWNQSAGNSTYINFSNHSSYFLYSTNDYYLARFNYTNLNNINAGGANMTWMFGGRGANASSDWFALGNYRRNTTRFIANTTPSCGNITDSIAYFNSSNTACAGGCWETYTATQGFGEINNETTIPFGVGYWILPLDIRGGRAAYYFNMTYARSITGLAGRGRCRPRGVNI